MFKLDREKYLEIFKNQGINAALTVLHHDKERYEQETFEGANGYQPQMWEDLIQFRNFSLELWDISLKQQKPDGMN